MQQDSFDSTRLKKEKASWISLIYNIKCCNSRNLVLVSPSVLLEHILAYYYPLTYGKNCSQMFIGSRSADASRQDPHPHVHFHPFI